MQVAPRCLVSGGAGLIGRALATELCRRGARVLVLDDLSAHGRFPDLPAEVECVQGDVRDRALLTSLCLHERPQWIFHLAATVGVRRVLRDPQAAFDSSIDGLESCLAACAALPTRPRIVFASSSEVYAEQSAPLAEDSALRAERHGRWAYAAAKLECERRLLRASPDSRVVRFFNVVGPGQSAEAGMVLPRFVERARAGMDLELHGRGDAQRTYAHADEVARTLAELAAHPRWHEPVLNIGGRARASARELAECVLRLSGSASRIRMVDPRVELGAQFEEVRTRVPALFRLERMGIAPPSMSLVEIVSDMLRRHAAPKEQACASRA